jgi:hypothetical protein
VADVCFKGIAANGAEILLRLVAERAQRPCRHEVGAICRMSKLIQINWSNNALAKHGLGLPAMHPPKWRHRLCEILEQGSAEDPISIAVNRSLIALIVITVIATILESVPDLAKQYRPAFDLIEVLAIAVFTAEYFLRVCPGTFSWIT